jgi:AcrR family transcriptional regulator
MAGGGRRPGHPDTRGEIVRVARDYFQEVGYADASLRGIAARAAVDPSLMHHYFPDGKAALFAEALQLARDPRLIVEEVAASGGGGAGVVRGFLRLWEGEGSGDFVSVAQAMCTSPTIADAVREYLTERIWSHKEGGQDVRRALCAAQLMGLAWVRYVLRVEPLASGDVDTVAALVGPTIDRYMEGASAPD